MDVLEHAFEPESLIRSIYDNLKDKGTLIMQVPSTGWLSELIFGKYHLGHLRYYDEKYLTNYLQDHGFHVEYTRTFNSVPFSSLFLRSKRLYKVLEKICMWIPHSLFPYYGSVAAVAKKGDT